MFEEKFLSNEASTMGVTYDQTPALQGDVWDAAQGLQTEVLGRYAYKDQMQELFEQRNNSLYEKLVADGITGLPDKAVIAFPRKHEQFMQAYGGDEAAKKELFSTGYKQSYEAYEVMQNQMRNYDGYETDQQLMDRAYANMNEAKLKHEDTLARNVDHGWTEFFGGMSAEAYNPDFYLSMLLGGQAKAGASIIGNMLRVGSQEAVIGAVYEGAVQPEIYKQLQKAGIDYSWEDATQAVLTTAGAGFLLGGTLQGAFQSGGALLKKLKGDNELLDQRLQEGLIENSDEIKNLGTAAKELESVVEKSVAQYGDGVSIEQVEVDLASYLARKNQFYDFVNNGDTPLEMAKRDYIESQLPLAGQLMTKGERKALDLEITELQQKANAEKVKYQKEKQAKLNKRQLKKTKGKLPEVDVKDETIDQINDQIKRLKSLKAQQVEAQKAASNLARANDGIYPEEVMQNTLKYREQRQGLIDQADSDILAQATTKADRSFNANFEAGKQAQAIEQPEINQAIADQVYTDYLTKADQDFDAIARERLNALTQKVDIEIPVRLEGVDEVELETTSARETLEQADKEIEGLESVLMCVRGSNG